MRLLLVRHAEIPSNVLGILDTAAPGPSLTATGRDQAQALAAELADEPLDAGWASVLVRTQETLAPTAAAHRLPVTVLDGLREIRAGDLEGERTRDAQRAYMTTVLAWGHGDLSGRMPGGESGHEFFERFDAALEVIAASGAKEAIVVSHGAAIRCWSAHRIEGADRDFLARNPLPNTGIVAIDGEPGAWRMRAWRDTEFGRPAAPAAPVAAPDPSRDPTGSATLD